MSSWGNIIRFGLTAAGLILLPRVLAATEGVVPSTPDGSGQQGASSGPQGVPATPSTVPTSPGGNVDSATESATGATAGSTLSPKSTRSDEGSWLSNLHAEDILKYDWGKLHFKPHFAVQSYFTDNFQYQTSGLQQSDDILYLSPGFQLQYGSIDYNHLLFDYSHDEIFYVNHSNYDTSQDHLNFSGVVAHNRWRVTGSDQVDFLSSFVGVGNTQRTILINRRTWKDVYGVYFDATDRIKPYVQGLHIDQDYDPASGYYNRQILRGAAGTSYALTSRVRVFSDLYYGQESPSATSPFQPSPYYQEFYGGEVGAEGEFTTRLSGRARIGFEERTVPHYSKGRPITSPLIAVDLTYVPTELSQVKLAAIRSTGSSDNTVSTTVTTKVDLTLFQYLTSSLKWALQANGSLSLTDYQGTEINDVNVPFPVSTPSGQGTIFLPTTVGNGRSDTDYSLGISLNYLPNRWLRCSLGYGFEHYQFSFSDHRYGLYSEFYTNGLRPFQVNSVTLSVSIGY